MDIERQHVRYNSVQAAIVNNKTEKWVVYRIEFKIEPRYPYNPQRLGYIGITSRTVESRIKAHRTQPLGHLWPLFAVGGEIDTAATKVLRRDIATHVAARFWEQAYIADHLADPTWRLVNRIGRT